MKNIQTNKKNIKSHQDGIALIITIVLTSIMLSSVVLVSREMVDEARNSTRIDNSLIAYYAAEAGLEDALLEWRYDHDAEISKENDDDGPEPNGVNVTDTDNSPRRVNITNDSINYNPPIYTNSYYDLTMWSKTTSISNQTLFRDNVTEYILPNMNQSLTLNWTKNPNTPSDSGYRVEITSYDEDGNIIPDGKIFSVPNDTSKTIPALGSGKKIIRVKLWYVKNNPIGTSYTEGSPMSEIPSITLNISPTTDTISGSTVNIESVGYFGGVARKIIASIDRSSGSIIGMNDFAIYSASDLIK